jgi:hypothetical protein
MPLVDDHRLEVGKEIVGIFERKEHRERFGRRHEPFGPALAEPAALGGGRVAGA